jgi:hypothetical protein
MRLVLPKRYNNSLTHRIDRYNLDAACPAGGQHVTDASGRCKYCQWDVQPEEDRNLSRRLGDGK